MYAKCVHYECVCVCLSVIIIFEHYFCWFFLPHCLLFAHSPYLLLFISAFCMRFLWFWHTKTTKATKMKKKWKKGFKWAPFAGDAMCAKRKMAAGHVNAAKRCRPLEIQADQQQQLRWIMNERGLGGEWRRGHKKYCCILMRACRCGSFIRNPHPHPLPSWHLKPQPGLRSTKLLYFCHNFQIIHILCMQQSLRCMSEWVSVRLCEMSLRMLLWQVEGVAVRS